MIKNYRFTDNSNLVRVYHEIDAKKVKLQEHHLRNAILHKVLGIYYLHEHVNFDNIRC